MRKLRWGMFRYKGNDKVGYTYTYRVFYDEKTYREISVKVKDHRDDLTPLRRNITRINLLFEAAMRKAGYKTEMTYSTFVNLSLDECPYITDNLLFLL